MANYPWATGWKPYAIPCCACPVECELVIPGSPFSTLEEAEAGMENVVSCRCYFYPSPFYDLPTTRIFSYDADSFNVIYSVESATESSLGPSVQLVAYLPVGTATYGISGTFNCESGIYDLEELNYSLFGPDGEIVLTGATGSVEIPTAGCYTFVISANGVCGCPPPPEDCLPGVAVALSASFTMTGMILAPAVAPYGSSVLYCE